MTPMTEGIHYQCDKCSEEHFADTDEVATYLYCPHNISPRSSKPLDTNIILLDNELKIRPLKTFNIEKKHD